MADITLTCSNCGNVITVSEFVAADSLTCMQCKSQVPIPKSSPAGDTPVQPKLKIAMAAPPPPPPPPEPATGKKKATKAGATPNNDVRKFLPSGGAKRKRARKASTFEVVVLPWLLFLVLTGVLGWMRFWPGALSASTLDTVITAGVWALTFFHVSIVCYAFSDDAFAGLLCIIIPGYSIYYLFILSDQMIMRAIAGSLLVVFGWDAVIATQKLWNEIYINVSHWIATTETFKK